MGLQIKAEVKRVLEDAYQCQQDSGDLLLLYVNGFYSADALKFQGNNNPYVIGLGSSGWSEQAHYNFIHKYRTTKISEISYKDYRERVVYNPEAKDERDKLIENEELSIQEEMLIYLKIWEGDMFIKRWYELSRIMNSEPYDWHFALSESARDKRSTGTRQDVIRLLIRDKIKGISPILYNLIKKCYITQIRNSIAHSKYSFQGRTIQLNNRIEQDQSAQLYSISFDDWVEIFHGTLLLYSEYIGMLNRINEFYASVAVSKNIPIPVKVIQGDLREYYYELHYRAEWNDWIPGKE